MAELSLSGLRILVAEDEYMIASDLRRDLQGRGTMVCGPAPTLERTIDLIETEPRIDAALLDINLNGDLVFPAADLLRERGVPFLFTTGYDKSTIPPRFSEVPLCMKPIDNTKIIAALQDLILTGLGGAERA